MGGGSVVVVLWVIAFMLFLIVLRLWPGLRSVIGCAAILALVLACLGGLAAAVYYAVERAGWQEVLIVVVIVVGAAMAAWDREQKKKLRGRRGPSDGRGRSE